MPEFRLTPAAERDLESIFKYTASRWGVSQAIRYTDFLMDAFVDLARSPLSAPSCDHIRAGYRRRSVERHIVYYRSTDYGVAIVRVLHDRMDAPRHL